MTPDREPDGLEVFLPVVARWFRATFGAPTPPQARGWPAIAQGKHTLILAPTGSGKTLAAFLACLDHLWRRPATGRGVRILYVSPLKALNNDISRNLDFPLRGIHAAARELGAPLAELRVGVRSGDTSPAERQRLTRKPPDILITTPESLHLMLTCRARETLRTVSHVIIDEIHALCGNKRGVFLALLLERLEAIVPDSFVRVGLSATQRPLEEVARYLGGSRSAPGRDPNAALEPRPVEIIDAGQRKDLDLEVVAPFAHPTAPRLGSVWPAIEEQLLDWVDDHRSTIIFANNRRVAERLTTRLNDRAAERSAAATGHDEPGLEDAPADADDPGRARSHHGSLSLEERRSTEEALKRGELAVVVATASLELGIDMGAVDLVCQVESPGSIARGLQRVGRSGHLVGGTSKGRLIAKTCADLLETAALCRAMRDGRVEATRVPTNCLDVLAQQVVACVAMDRWDVPALFGLVRRADPYRNLTAEAFESVLNMVSGRFPVGSFRDLRAQVAWDRVHNRLAPLPGTARLALTGGGTIPDTGQYPVLLGENGPRLGELDEEFVLERRVGETFVLGTATWRIDAIDPSRVIVSRAEGQSAVLPFWRGEKIGRSAELGEAVGVLSRMLTDRLDDPGVRDWLSAEYGVDPHAARLLRDYLGRQARVAGVVPDDRTILLETFRDRSGDVGLALLTPWGGRLHQALQLVIQGRIRQRFGVVPACLHGDEGLLIRLPRTEGPPLDLLDGLTPDLAERLILEELGESALFGLRFRQNAGRALLMPRPDPAKRTPLWLQRLRAKDLLQVVRKFPDFPIVVETFRECLVDDLDLPRLRSFLGAVSSGAIRVVTRDGEVPSPFVSDLIFRFEMVHLYEWDAPKNGRRPGAGADVDGDLLGGLLDDPSSAPWLDPAAVSRVDGRLRGVGRPPRTTEEMAETLRKLGDLRESELAGPMAAFLLDLEREGRALRIVLPGGYEPERWIGAEDAPLYRSAFPPGLAADPKALGAIVERYIRTRALVDLAEIRARYPIDVVDATELLERATDAWGVVRIDPTDGEDGPRWADAANLREVRRLSVALRRRECLAVAPEVYADFLLRWQGVHPSTRREGGQAVELVLDQLQGLTAPADLWESEVLPARVRDYRPAWLDEALAGGGWTWSAEGDGRASPSVGFVSRDGSLARRAVAAESPLSDDAEAVLAQLERQGASFVTDLARGSGREPSRVRSALEELVRLGLVSNDRFDPMRPGVGNPAPSPRARAQASGGRAGLRLRRPATTRPEGRWWRLPPEPSSDPDASLDAWAAVLLDRHGVLTRETIAPEAWAPPWRDLATRLARAELRGEVRRGYFVEGLSGVQYATPEAAERLAQLAQTPEPHPEPILIATLDPANVYGGGAAFDIELLEGGTARLCRTPGNQLVLCGGRLVLIVEAFGRRLTGLASASETELRAAVALLPRLARPPRRVVKVETYNGAAALASPAAPWLAEVGFVRDHPGMAYYAGWSPEEALRR